MTLTGLITHEYGLDDINDALDLFRSGKAGRILIKMSKIIFPSITLVLLNLCRFMYEPIDISKNNHVQN